MTRNSPQSRNKPVLLYDGDCTFCRKWIERWKRVTGESVRYEPYQEVLDSFPQVSERQCRESVQLVMPSGKVFSGAHAVFRSMAEAGRCRFLLWTYENLPVFRNVSERMYRFTARHRDTMTKLS